MKTKSIPNLKFKDLGNDAFSVSTPTEHISLNSVILLVAKKQSGKTFFASNLMNQLKQVKACDRIFVISDTFNSNKKINGVTKRFYTGIKQIIISNDY